MDSLSIEVILRPAEVAELDKHPTLFAKWNIPNKETGTVADRSPTASEASSDCKAVFARLWRFVSLANSGPMSDGTFRKRRDEEIFGVAETPRHEFHVSLNSST